LQDVTLGYDHFDPKAEGLREALTSTSLTFQGAGVATCSSGLACIGSAVGRRE